MEQKLSNYRPFKNCWEFMDAFALHSEKERSRIGMYVQDMSTKYDENDFADLLFIDKLTEYKVKAGGEEFDLQTLMTRFAFPDGTPCGAEIAPTKKEEPTE